MQNTCQNMPMTSDAAMMIAKYGVTKQLSQVQEEAAELIVAISHFLRRRDGAIDEMIEEAADVAVMLEQVRLIVGSDALDRAITASQNKIKAKLRLAKVHPLGPNLQFAAAMERPVDHQS